MGTAKQNKIAIFSKTEKFNFVKIRTFSCQNDGSFGREIQKPCEDN